MDYKIANIQAISENLQRDVNRLKAEVDDFYENASKGKIKGGLCQIIQSRATGIQEIAKKLFTQLKSLN